MKDLDAAFNFLLELSKSATPLREVDVRELHRLAVRNRQEAQPGNYRTIGVVIAGSEHKPPEPIAVPSLVQKTVEWFNTTASQFPVAGAAYVHHQIAAIHPFLDGNGRTARLLMNLVFLRMGYPVVNVRREDRSRYYEGLAFADVGLYSPLVELILERAGDVFSEMKRVREETERMRIFAERWGQAEAAVIQRREEREYRQWLAQMELVRLAFENAADLLDEKLKEIRVDFWKYPEPEFAKYLELREKGKVAQSWFFRIRLRNQRTATEENFVFNFFRALPVFQKRKVIPLVPNRAGQDGQYGWLVSPKIRLREVFIDEAKQLNVRMQHSEGPDGCSISKKLSPEEAAQEFFDDVLKECFGLRQY